MDATAKLLAIVALAAFVTERILAAANTIINAERLYRVRRGAAVRLRDRERRKAVLMVLAGAIAVVVVDRADLRILRLLQIGDVHALVDFWLTWLVVFAGADRVHTLLQGGGSSGASAGAEKDETPVVRVQIDGGEISKLQRVG